MRGKARNILHGLFEAGTLLKGAHAVFEIVAGSALPLIGTSRIQYWVEVLTRRELLEDPQDKVATLLLHLAQGYSISDQQFYSWYLLSHGVVKLALVIGLLRGWLWAYPASLLALAAFMAYQLYRYSFTHSPFLLALTVFDAFFMWLVYLEYRSKTRAVQI